MRIIDLGRGEPVVIVPGIQGRWEWMRPGVEALARHCRVITFSLGDEPTAEYDGTEQGFDRYVGQIARALDSAGLQRATICGVSFGGLVAAAFAARHPERVTSLVLASALPPSWKLDKRAGFYLRSPRLFAPLFCLSSLRLYREIAAARPGFWNGVSAALRHAANVTAHPFNAQRMAGRALMTTGLDWSGLNSVQVPTLLVTGEPSLDRVVPPSMTLEYLRLWPKAHHATLPRTGHLGIITRPQEFAGIVTSFLDLTAHGAPPRRRVG
jgi:pimeloyl-ACP methyl ester carboxylesterase